MGVSFDTYFQAVVDFGSTENSKNSLVSLKKAFNNVKIVETDQKTQSIFNRIIEFLFGFLFKKEVQMDKKITHVFTLDRGDRQFLEGKKLDSLKDFRKGLDKIGRLISNSDLQTVNKGLLEIIDKKNKEVSPPPKKKRRKKEKNASLTFSTVVSKLSYISESNNNSITNWIKGNLPFIKQVYDQTNDTERNMGAGTCFENTLERVKVLHDNPVIKSGDISMGSSKIGRGMRRSFDKIKTSEEDVSQQGKKAAKLIRQKLGLELVSMTSTGRKNLGKQVKELDSKGFTNLCLGMDSSAGEYGHAINMQFYRDKNLFRFIDDNLGVVECSTPQQFGKTLVSWLKTMYADLDKMTVDVYQPVNFHS
ncbi:hypothetical protein [Candidatus Neptunochlamydia vexilliferae]|uniref:Peptidase C58 YopT-type domain-containing protein n=1 Tax=Candidatus Neptunichlamydia vexilliferae TaxID=1651774 RepID=A0ABS0AYT8_9BACT|nr:hypothetical protein [Candidatus Neptunochlamydia vexilliferae]MBF5058777.1 hypothetical protein [Candidatus Neptunochlamydia vexilliferae]